MKKILVPIFVLCLLMCLSLTVGATSLSPGLAVICGKMKMVKTGVGMNSVAFCAEDFESFVGTKVESVKILSVPDAASGKLMLGEDEVQCGLEIAAEQLSALRFVPVGEGASASFEFAPDGGEESRLCAVTMLSSLDFSPETSDVAVSAIENVSYSGTLTANDPEGDEISFHVAKNPRHGTLTLDVDTGKYIYVPEKDYHGGDKFTYTAIDEFGNVSDVAEVKITVAKNKNGIVYADMENNPSYTAAVTIGENGIIVGEVIGGQRYFYPEKSVTRGEFLVTAMSALGIAPANPEPTEFYDDSEISDVMRGYVCAAVENGTLFGIETENGRCFFPDEPITVSQAATLLSRMMSLEASSSDDALPVLASQDFEITDEGLSAMKTLGYFENQNASDTLSRADAALLLFKMIS